MIDARSQVGIALLKRLVVTGALIAGLTACGSGQDEAADADKAGQAVATVNGADVTVHQLNYLLARLPGAAQAPDPAALKRQAADQLVTRQLLLERARAQKLDRDPAVMLALEEGRQQLLAQAHLERVMAQAVAPTDDEIRKYYDEQSLKYAQRKQFLMRQVATDNTVPREELDAYGQGDVTAEGLVKWLQERGAKVRVSIRTLASEQVPAPILERLQTLKPGRAIMVGSATESTVSFLVEAR
ncbi:MAG: EpsD family peptidyl-prolyl cis-trans isomerase, partial [Gammaproteobacteria bacterium]